MHKEEDPIECGLCECARVSLAPKRAFNILPREYIEYSRDLPGAPFTMIPPRLSHRISFFLPNALLYYVKFEKQTNKQFSNGTLGSCVVNGLGARLSRYLGLAMRTAAM